jgi:hypothetical protein
MDTEKAVYLFVIPLPERVEIYTAVAKSSVYAREYIAKDCPWASIKHMRGYTLAHPDCQEGIHTHFTVDDIPLEYE